MNSFTGVSKMIRLSRTFHLLWLIGLSGLGVMQLLPTNRAQAIKSEAPFAEQHRSTGSAPVASKLRIEDTLARLPLRFEPNPGGQSSRVKFVGRANNYGVFLTDNGAVFTLRSNSPASEQTRVNRGESPKGFALLRMTLKNSRRHPRIEGVDETSHSSNYFRGKTGWQTDIKSFARVRYEEVYDGVDLIYYGNPKQLEYDFIVAPGASPQAIRLQFNADHPLSVDSVGDLILRRDGVELTLRAPAAYQYVDGARREVDCHFEVNSSGEVSFKLGAYDKRTELTIDPVFSYSTYLGGTGFSSQSDEIVNGIAVDGEGNAYVVGTTVSTDFPVLSAYKQQAEAPQMPSLLRLMLPVRRSCTQPIWAGTAMMKDWRLRLTRPAQPM